MTDCAIITGASRGIGKAVALRLARRGMALVLVARDEGQLEQVKTHALIAGAPSADVFALDVQNESAIKDCFRTLQQRKQVPEVLVNCAGFMVDAPLIMTTLSQVQQLLAVNMVGSFLFCQYAARLMARQRRGKIINLASKVGESGAQGQAAYAASKAAIIGLTKSLAKELGPLGISVNAVSPGFIETDLTAHYNEPQQQTIRELIALGRFGLAEEVAAVIDFLCSDAASYINGHILTIDGSMTL